jgi:NAD(P)-dependent dehydrogenase (short-subunit alcohol dehydrogenase family)
MSDKKVCLITGATSGIGKATLLSLARQGMSIVMVSRNKEKGESVRAAITEKTRNEHIHLAVADLSSQQDIRKLASEIKSKYSRLDILVNNAGGIFGKRVLTVDGLELTFALNHLAYFLLTNLLLEILKAAPAGRVVNVSSQAHRYGSMEFDDPGFEKGYNAMKSYAQSKLANLLFTYELSRRLAGTGITANALHPGVVRTGFGKELSGIAGLVFKRLDFLMRSPEKGAETVIWLASSSEPKQLTGKYFCDRREIRSSRVSYDHDAAKRLWESSVQMTGLESHSTH